MRIGIDNISPGLSTTTQTLGGMRHWMGALLHWLPSLGSRHSFELFSPSWCEPFPQATATNLRLVPDLHVPKNRYARAWYEQASLPGRIGERDISVWLGSCNTLPLRAGCRTVLLVQSVQFRSHPETYGVAQRQYLQTLLRLSVRRADRIVVLSEATKRQIQGWYEVGGDRIDVVPHAVRFSVNPHPANPTEREEVYKLTGGPYILSVSAFYPYKNLKRLIQAFALLARPLGLRLAIVGAATPWLTTKELMATAHEAGVDDRVVFLGRVSDENLPMLYRQAALTAMVSLEETFGHPVVEAMAFGCPVVTSNVSSMPELVGHAGVLVDPLDVDSIADGLRRVLDDAAEQQRLREAGPLRARLFTYERSFSLLLQSLETVAG